MARNLRLGRTRLTTAMLVVLAAIASGCAPATQAKYVFVFIGDGMGPAQRAAAEIYLSGPQEPNQPPRLRTLVMNSLPVHGAARSSSSDSLTTDSGAAATAIATGHKVPNAAISMDFEGGRKLTTIAEIAKEQGWRVGIVSSSSINDATPAAFYAHQPTRGNLYDIAWELVDSRFDYFAGAGPFGVTPEVDKGRASPILEANQRGVQIVRDRESLLAVRPGTGKVWARLMGSDGNNPSFAEMDRPVTQPSLADLTRKGIELLDNPKGFLLMVEGGNIDGTGHSHDAASSVRETLALDQAVAEAMEFYERHPRETLIIVTADHETGGMGLGAPGGSLFFLQERLSRQKGSMKIFADKVVEWRQRNATFEEAVPAIKEFYGLEEIPRHQEALLAAAYAESMKEPNLRTKDATYMALYSNLDPLSAACANYVSRRAGIGWTTYGHTAVPLPVSAIGVGSEQFTGYYENTELFRRILAVMVPARSPR